MQHIISNLPDPADLKNMAGENRLSIRHRLADALESCMRKATLEKITVRQITDECGVSRQTFYRNFADKYDLINWYFDELLNKAFEHMGYGNTVYDGLVHKFTYIRDEKFFFKAAFRNDSQNNLRDHDTEMIMDFYRKLIAGKMGVFPQAQYGELLEMYCVASVYMTQQWVLKGCSASPDKMAQLMIEAMPPKLSELFARLAILDSRA